MQLSVKDVAGLLEVSEKTVYRWIEDGKLPGYRISGQYRFNRAELLAWATAEKIHISPGIFLEPEADGGVMPTLEEALVTGGVHYRISGTTPDECLRNTVELLRLPEGVDREFLLQVLIARERLEPTAVGGGVAIPHLRNPIVLHLQKPMVALCFLESAVDFHAIDGQPVRVLFTLISPSVKAHLHLQSRLSFALLDPDFRALLVGEAPRDQIFTAVRHLQDRWTQRTAPQQVSAR